MDGTRDSSKTYFQDQMSHNNCFGCGSANERGLGIKSFWDEGGDEAVCIWTPGTEHKAGPEDVLNGGIICTIFDCHCICTAIAQAYRDEEREIGTEPMIWCVTGRISVDYHKPTPIDLPVELRSRIEEKHGRKTVVACSLFSDGKKTATAEVLAVRVPPEVWYRGH